MLGPTPAAKADAELRGVGVPPVDPMWESDSALTWATARSVALHWGTRIFIRTGETRISVRV